MKKRCRMNETGIKTIILSQKKIYKIVFNNLDRFFYVLWAVIVLFTYRHFNTEHHVRLIYLTIAMALMFLFYTFLVRKVLHKIILNLSDKTVTFYPYKTRKAVTYNFDQIKRVKVNGAIYIKVNEMWFAYSTTDYSKVLKAMCRIRDIEWGGLCNLLGPAADEREILTFECNKILHHDKL